MNGTYTVYRADIDGLRAVAVLGVLLYHARGFGVSGGYGGVDVFFTISGFLITQILIVQMREGSFDVGAFYERRIRRIAPALAAMLVVSTAVAAWVLFPDDLKQHGKVMQAVVILSANLFFQRKTGYFESDSERVPLLHTWSLAVEEQFYLVFPIMLWGLFRWGPRAVLPVILLVLVASLSWSVILTQTAPTVAFFSTPARVWELLTGALLPVCADNDRLAPPRWLRETAAAAGLALICYGYFFYDDTTVFPGPKAAVFCGGAALIIWAGMHGSHTAVGNLLSQRWIVALGLVSYSVYLWHWPLIVFWRYRFGGVGDVGLTQSVALVAASLLLGALSWRFIELPFRGKHVIFDRKRVFAAFGALTVLSLAVAFVILRTHGFEGRWPADVISMLKDQRSAETRLCKPFAGASEWRDEVCSLGNADKARIIVWGDSHARALIEPLAEGLAADRPGILVAWMGGCPPLAGVRLHGRGKLEACHAFSGDVLRLIERLKPRLVVISARWAHYFSPVDLEKRGFPIMLSSEGVEHNPHVAGELLAESVRRVRAAGSEVLLLASVPEQSFTVAPAMAAYRMWGQALPPALTTSEHMHRQRNASSALQALAAQPSVTLRDPAKYFCRQNICDYQKDGWPLYTDSNHLNRAGLELAGPIIAEILRFN